MAVSHCRWYAMVINMMANLVSMAILRNRFAFAAISQLTLIATNCSRCCLAFIYLNLSKTRMVTVAAELRLLTLIGDIQKTTRKGTIMTEKL